MSDYIERILQHIGLSKNEAQIYLCLIKNGQLAVSSLAVKSGVNRRNAYDCLKRLAEKGLVFEIIKSKELVYAAVNPTKLREVIKEKEKKLESIFPEISALYQQIPQERAVFIYQGVEGWKNYLKDIVKVGEPFYCIGGKGAWMDSRVMDFFPTFIKEAKRKKIAYKHLFDHEVRESAHNILKFVGKDFKFLPKQYSAPASIDFFGDRVYICSTLYLGGIEKDATFTVIINQNIADSFRSWFNFMWDLCPE